MNETEILGVHLRDLVPEPFLREKARADEFLITASVLLLTIDLREKKW